MKVIAILSLFLCTTYGDDIQKDKLWLKSLQILLTNKSDIAYRSHPFDELNDVSFWLFTRDTSSYDVLKLGNVQSVKQSHFDMDKDTKILVHGWISTGPNSYNVVMKNAILKAMDVNVICVTWPSDTLYTIARLAVNPTAKVLSKFLNFLIHDCDVNKETIHLLGHSLGAHVVGIAGANTKYSPLPWITGFDPAAPLFSLADKSNRIDKSDAAYVDIIHTTGGYLGFLEPIGHVDYFPNGGTPIQPGCGFDIGVCSHDRSYEYYIASMSPSNQFFAVPCSSYRDFKNARCCKGSIEMGPEKQKQASGTYYLQTSSKSPFALGKGSIVEPCWHKKSKRIDIISKPLLH